MTSKHPVSRYRKTFSPLITSGALSLHGLTQRQLATALAFRSGGLTAAEPLLVAAQSTSHEVGVHRAPVRRACHPLHGYTIPQTGEKSKGFVAWDLDV